MRQKFHRAFDMCDRAWNYAHDILTREKWFGRPIPSGKARWLANQVVTKEKKEEKQGKKADRRPDAKKQSKGGADYRTQGWTSGINPLFESDPEFFDSSICPSDFKRSTVQKLCDAINSTLALRKANKSKSTTNTGAPRAKRHKPDERIPTDCLVVGKRNSREVKSRSFAMNVAINKGDEKRDHPTRCLRWDLENGFRFSPTWLQRPDPGGRPPRKRAQDKHMNAIPPFSRHKIKLEDGSRSNRELYRLTQAMGRLLYCPRQATLKYERPGRYYLIVPFEVGAPCKRNDDGRPARAIALDPGVRTFQTGFDLLGRCVEIGKDSYRKPTGSDKRSTVGGTGVILARLKRIDRQISKAAKAKPMATAKT
jgi:hypothetical protein